MLDDGQIDPTRFEAGLAIRRAKRAMGFRRKQSGSGDEGTPFELGPCARETLIHLRAIEPMVTSMAKGAVPASTKNDK